MISAFNHRLLLIEQALSHNSAVLAQLQLLELDSVDTAASHVVINVYQLFCFFQSFYFFTKMRVNFFKIFFQRFFIKNKRSVLR